jgi:hypothetical protein
VGGVELRGRCGSSRSARRVITIVLAGIHDLDVAAGGGFESGQKSRAFSQ